MQTGFFATARKVIGKYGGVVEKYIGDAVMALFGAPIATETDAVRCVRAGLELQRVLARFTAPGSTGPRFRVGVATGEALVDVAAAHDGGQAIVAGEVVNTASRLQSAAPPGGVLVDGATHAATGTSIRYTEQPPARLRGRSVPVEVWLAEEPLGPAHPDREMGSTPLVNRTHELDLLVKALNRALRERTPRLVTVLGLAGIGKSRLVHELYRHAQRVSDEPVVWRTGRCPPFGENVTYAALADIVKAQAGILDTDTADTARKRLDATLRELVEPDEAVRLGNALSPLVGLPGSGLAADETESAWRRFVAALAGRYPTVLVFEDLHWADESMLRFIELLGASVRDVPLLLLCTARPELVSREPTWASAIGGALTITLPPLRDAEIATMYAHLLGQVAFTGESLGPLVELADGNPLYAHEYTRMLAEHGALRDSAMRIETVPMPDSVHAVIANRVDLLEPADRAVLQAAAVVGMQFWPGAVAAALGRSVDGVERSLRRLEQRDLIHERLSSTMAGQHEYRFGHVLVRDVCYRRLPRTDRIAGHERTADWLDMISADRDTDLAEVLAHHRYTAHEIARTLAPDTARDTAPARGALKRAAQRACALHALEAAANHAKRALDLCDERTPTADRLQLELLTTEISFHTDGEAFLAGGGSERLTDLAERLAAAGDDACAARAWTLLGQAAWLRADRRGAMAHLNRAVALYRELPDTTEKADAFAELGRLHMINYEDAPAVAAATTAASIAERLDLPEVHANARITAAGARYFGGDPGGLAELQELVRLCRNQRLLALRRAVRNLHTLVCEEGDWRAADALLTQAATVMPGGQNLTIGYAEDATRAFFAGEWDRLLALAETIIASPGGEWDLQMRGVRSWIMLLRDPVPGDLSDGVPGLLAAGERSGFHRLRWTALAHGGLSRAVQGHTGEATDLVVELAARWREVRSNMLGEFLPAAAHAAALSGRRAATTLGEMLGEVRHRTGWVRAAMHTISGALTDDGRAAAEHHHAAADLYAGMPNRTDGIMSLAIAVRAVPGSAASRFHDERTGPWCEELREFANRNEVPGLMRIAGLR